MKLEEQLCITNGLIETQEETVLIFSNRFLKILLAFESAIVAFFELGQKPIVPLHQLFKLTSQIGIWMLKLVGESWVTD